MENYCYRRPCNRCGAEHMCVEVCMYDWQYRDWLKKEYEKCVKVMIQIRREEIQFGDAVKNLPPLKNINETHIPFVGVDWLPGAVTKQKNMWWQKVKWWFGFGS